MVRRKVKLHLKNVDFWFILNLQNFNSKVNINGTERANSVLKVYGF